MVREKSKSGSDFVVIVECHYDKDFARKILKIRDVPSRMCKKFYSFKQAEFIGGVIKGGE